MEAELRETGEELKSLSSRLIATPAAARVETTTTFETIADDIAKLNELLQRESDYERRLTACGYPHAQFQASIRRAVPRLDEIEHYCTMKSVAAPHLDILRSLAFNRRRYIQVKSVGKISAFISDIQESYAPRCRPIVCFLRHVQ